MSLAAWVESRTPPAPAELRNHLLAELAARAALLDAADAALVRVLDAGAASRDSALDLLSADAFVTYAFEAAADEPRTVSSTALDAMRRISIRAVPYLDQNAK